MVNPNPGLKSRNSQWICHLGGFPNSTHKNTLDRLDKLCSSLAEAQLKMTTRKPYGFMQSSFWVIMMVHVMVCGDL